MSSPDSAVRCLTSSFSVAPSASCEYRSFQCWLVPSHPKCNEFMFCRQKIWAKDSNVHDGMASEVPCTDLFEIKAKKHQRNQAFPRFKMNIWCNFNGISSKEKPTSLDSGRSTHRGAFGMRWLLTILERRCDETRETQCEFPKVSNSQPHTEAVHDIPRNVELPPVPCATTPAIP